MSFTAAAWAIKQRPKLPSEKLVLILLADCHNESTNRCDPSMDYLALHAMCEKRTAIRATESLEQQGFLTILRQQGRRNRYTLNIEEDQKAVTKSHQCQNVTRDNNDQSGDINAQSGDMGVTQTYKNQEEPEKGIVTLEQKKQKRQTANYFFELLPPDIDRDLWRDFIDLRKKLKAQNTERAINTLISDLTEFQLQGMDPNEVIERSIVNSWKGVYPLKQRGGTHGTSRPDSKPDLDERLKNTNWFSGQTVSH